MISKELLAATLQHCPEYKVATGPIIHAYHRLSSEEKKIVELVQHMSAVIDDAPDADLVERLIGTERFRASSEKCIAAQEDLARGYHVYGLCLDDYTPPPDDTI